MKALRSSWATSFSTTKEAEYGQQTTTWKEVVAARGRQKDRRNAKKEAAEKFLLKGLDEETQALIPIVAALKSLTRIAAIRALLGPNRELLVKQARALLEERQEG